MPERHTQGVDLKSLPDKPLPGLRKLFGIGGVVTVEIPKQPQGADTGAAHLTESFTDEGVVQHCFRRHTVMETQLSQVNHRPVCIGCTK
ncbi:hypothetical protein SDC9_194540 [bioreactor metagenome]|uniref:Uncharacterized protein n=1 Tax=bioreactor metagenome TaxID=1076179 RepID=A0A645I6K9_9ZZZZ